MGGRIRNARVDRVIPQPPINRSGRRDGRSRPWLAVLLLAVGLGLLGAGLLRTHPVARGASIPERELVRLVARGGVHRTPATQQSGRAVLQPVEKPPEACPT